MKLNRIRQLSCAGLTATVLAAAAAIGAFATTAQAAILGFSFDARAYGVDQTFDTTAGNVAVSGTYNDTVSDGSGRFQINSFSWMGAPQLEVGGYTCADTSTCSSNASDFFWYDPVAGTPFMELHDGSNFFTFASPLGNIYSQNNSNGTWNVADIVNFDFAGTATGVNNAFDPVSGNVSASGFYDAGTSDGSGLNPLVSLSWSGDPVLEALDYTCAELAVCASDLDDPVLPDILLFDPSTDRPYFRLHDNSFSLFLSYGVPLGNIYSPGNANGTWDITSLTVVPGGGGGPGGGTIDVPEPGTLVLFSIGLAGLGFAARRRRTS
jgi:PEP-CTERM motif